VLEYNSAGAVVGRNVYGKAIDEILMRTDPAVNSGQPFYYQQDHQGSVTHLTNANGTVIESYRYDAFGAPTTMSSSGTYNNRFRFTGRECNTTFGFYEYRARAYNPTLGRFMSEDPKGFDAGDYNLYRYVHNDPLDLTDPMGLDSEIWARTVERLQAYEHAKEMFCGGAIEIGGLRYAAQQVQLRASYAKMNEQKLSQLSPLFAPMARHFVNSANQELHPEGYEVRITNDGGYRSFAEQAELRRKYEAGGPQANRPGESAHNYGAAIDVAIIRGSRLVEARKGSTEYQGLIGHLGSLGERQGLIWGGHFTHQDPPHFQYPGIPVSGPDMLRLHYTLMTTLGVGLNTFMGVP